MVTKRKKEFLTLVARELGQDLPNQECPSFGKFLVTEA